MRVDRVLGSRRPVVIIGAPRSGTNMLRDLICRLDGYGTWPCDEIDPIWRYGNQLASHDEFGPDMATDRVRRFIRRSFDRLAAQGGLETVVEKTCANSLRVPFVDRVLPDTRFVFIVRNGRDAVASAAIKRRESADLSYVLHKVRYIPVTNLLSFCRMYVRDRTGSAPIWGPRCRGMPPEFKHDALLASAFQWRRCVELAATHLGDLPAHRVLKIRYEELATNPADQMRLICKFLDDDVSGVVLQDLVEGVVATNIGKWERSFDEKQLQQVEEVIGPTLTEHGY